MSSVTSLMMSDLSRSHARNESTRVKARSQSPALTPLTACSLGLGLRCQGNANRGSNPGNRASMSSIIKAPTENRAGMALSNILRDRSKLRRENQQSLRRRDKNKTSMRFRSSGLYPTPTFFTMLCARCRTFWPGPPGYMARGRRRWARGRVCCVCGSPGSSKASDKSILTSATAAGGTAEAPAGEGEAGRARAPTGSAAESSTESADEDPTSCSSHGLS